MRLGWWGRSGGQGGGAAARALFLKVLWRRAVWVLLAEYAGEPSPPPGLGICSTPSPPPATPECSSYEGGLPRARATSDVAGLPVASLKNCSRGSPSTWAVLLSWARGRSMAAGSAAFRWKERSLKSQF